MLPHGAVGLTQIHLESGHQNLRTQVLCSVAPPIKIITQGLSSCVIKNVTGSWEGASKSLEFPE